VLDSERRVRTVETGDQGILNGVSEILKSSGFDLRWLALTEKGICSPKLIIQFREDAFYGSRKLSGHFSPTSRFFEPGLNRFTYLLDLEIVKAFYEYDIAVYRIRNIDDEVINALPSIDIDFSVLSDDETRLFCLQSSPAGFLGRLLNKASIEGYLDQYQVFHDRFGGNYLLEGCRYLIRGYFRFGSSGAPYLIYRERDGAFSVNAVQSEASPVQLSINNSREGNYQYVNAIASPLFLIQKELKSIMA
jgi:hypothetical protein